MPLSRFFKLPGWSWRERRPSDGAGEGGFSIDLQHAREVVPVQCLFLGASIHKSALCHGLTVIKCGLDSAGSSTVERAPLLAFFELPLYVKGIADRGDVPPARAFCVPLVARCQTFSTVAVYPGRFLPIEKIGEDLGCQ